MKEKEKCVCCNQETERDGEDSLYHGDTGPLCDNCLDHYEDRFGKDNGFMDKETLDDIKYHRWLDDKDDPDLKRRRAE